MREQAIILSQENLSQAGQGGWDGWMRGRERRVGGDEVGTGHALKAISRTLPFILNEVGSQEGFSTGPSHDLGQIISVLRLDGKCSSRETG